MKELMSMTDDQLAGLYISGNTEAFDVLLDRYKDRLYAYIRFIVRDSDAADDIFQETFVKAITTLQRGAYTGSGKFGAWLTRIAHNLIMDGFRQERSVTVLSNDASETDLFAGAEISDSNIEDSLVNTQVLEDVRRLVQMLPDTQREVVFLRFYQDLSFKEIADMTGVSINTALGRMRYALINMRRIAEEKNIALTLS